MAIQGKKGCLPVLFIVIGLVVPFWIIYYVSTDRFKKEYVTWQDELPRSLETEKTAGTSVSDRVVLPRGERVRSFNTSLRYRGIEKGFLVLDLYLEELDPNYAYVQKIPVPIKPGRVLGLGDVTYSVAYASDGALGLEIVKILETR